MKKSMQAMTMLYFVFAAFLGASGWALAEGFTTLSEVISQVGFVIPLILFVIYIRRQKGELRIPLIENREGLILSMPFVFISLICVMGISYLTTLILSLLGKGEGERLSGDIIYLLSRYALLPSVLEELLFRLVPLSLIAPYSRKSALVLSSLMFALVHCDLFEIPYALFAGVLYMLVDIMAGSVLPSIIIHLVNNVVAIIWQIYFVPNGLVTVVLVIIAALALISALAIVLLRKRYKPYIKQMLDKSDRLVTENAGILFIIFFSIVSVFSIF